MGVILTIVTDLKRKEDSKLDSFVRWTLCYLLKHIFKENGGGSRCSCSSPRQLGKTSFFCSPLLRNKTTHWVHFPVFRLGIAYCRPKWRGCILGNTGDPIISCFHWCPNQQLTWNLSNSIVNVDDVIILADADLFLVSLLLQDRNPTAHFHNIINAT